MQFADPRTDFVFRLIFDNEKAKDILISFLNAVLGLDEAHAIDAVTILNPYQAPKISTMKTSFVDVKCRDRRGVEFVVEMQVQYTEGFEKRVQYNACKAYVGQLATGENYPKLNQVIAISILDFALFKDFEHYLSRHEIRETRTNNHYLSEIIHYFIELPKFKLAAEQLSTAIEKWCYFIKHVGHLEIIPATLDAEPFRKAFDLASRANMTKEEWEVYDAASMKIQDQRGMVTAARKETKQEIARVLKVEGVPTALIAKATGLSEHEIEEIAKTVE